MNMFSYKWQAQLYHFLEETMNNVSCGAVIGAVLVMFILAVLHRVEPSLYGPTLNQDCVREIQWQDAMKAEKRNVENVCAE
jgi:recombinational DNA repair protein (RecF pathway)